MKKFISLFLASALLAVSGCSGNTGEDSTSSTGGEDTSDTVSASDDEGAASTSDTESSESSVDLSALVTRTNETASPDESMSEEEQRQLMIDNSLMTLGDTSRMVKVFKKAAAGEEITVGYIGGSITEGLTAGDDDCYAKLSYLALCEMFPDTKINYVNAGLSGTPSVLGVVRAERDLFGEYQPDIVFIEFAVNDGGDQIYKECYESLIKKVLDKDNEPAVVLLFTVLKSRYSCQTAMSQIGAYYSLPMISVGDAINPMFDAGLMEWEDYSDDESHPNVWGHELVKDFIANYFEQVKAIADETDTVPEAPAVPDTAIYTTDYSEIQLLERDQMNVTDVEGFTENDNIIATFNNGWTYRSSGGASITFTAEFRILFLVFNCNNSDKYADAQVYIDGELVNTVASNRSGGWGNPEADIAYTGTETAEHEVTIVIAESDESNIYGLLGIGIC